MKFKVIALGEAECYCSSQSLSFQPKEGEKAPPGRVTDAAAAASVVMASNRRSASTTFVHLFLGLFLFSGKQIQPPAIWYTTRLWPRSKCIIFATLLPSDSYIFFLLLLYSSFFFFFFFFFFDLSFLLEIIIIIVAIFLVFDSRGCHRHLVVAVILFIYLFLCQSLSFFLCLSLPVSACLCLSLLSLRAMELIQQKFGWMVWRADHFFGILPRPVGFIQFERFRHSKATLDFWFVLLLLLLLLLVLLFWLIPLELLDCFSRRFRIQFPSFLDKSSQKQRDKTERNESYQYCSRWDSYSNDPFSFHRHSWRPLGWIEGFVPSVWLNCSIFCCCCFDF